MKRKLILLIIIFLCTGCVSSVKHNEETSKKEMFTEERYVYFPDVDNIISYLGIDIDTVTILNESEKQLEFCFLINDLTYKNDETAVYYEDYIRKMESNGFKLSLYDGTISSTFELKNSSYTITITIISDVELWKKDNQDMVGIDKIMNNNIIYKIYRNK